MTTGSTLKDRMASGILQIILHLKMCPNNQLQAESYTSLLATLCLLHSTTTVQETCSQYGKYGRKAYTA